METYSPNIYLVEDDLFYNKVVKESLAKNHFNVKTFTNGAEYLKEIQKHQPDLAIIDYKLTDSNGIELLEKTKSINKAINVVILSAQQKLDVITEVLKKGASYIQKDQSAFSKLKVIARKTAIEVEEKKEERSAMMYRLLFFAIFTIIAVTVILLSYRYPALFNNRD
ncbi:MAG: response regulator [Bacteroidia bacterium]